MSINYHALLERLQLESSKENTLLWSKLKSFPLGGVKNPIVINHKEFIVAPNKSPKFNINALYKYTGGIENKWNEYIKYPSDLPLTSDHVLAFDDEKQLLYVHNRQAYILLFDIKSQECKSLKINHMFDVRNAYTNSTGIIINNEFNIIGGMRNKSHITFNNKLRTFSSHKYIFNAFQTGFYSHGSVCVKRKNMEVVLLFGGMDAMNSKGVDTIYKYDIIKKKWSKEKITLPNKLSQISCVLTQNKKYVILFGGVVDEYLYTDDIYIYDIDNNRILKSRVNCPNKQHRYGSVILSDYSNIQSQLLICGYLRQVFKINNFPLDVVSVIKLLFNAEYVHLIQCNKGTHWKILVAEIISNATEQ
eukprot:313987_1